MSTSWPIGVAVIVVGGLAGVLIAGRPGPVDSFVLEPSITTVESPSTSGPVVATTIAETTTVSASTSVASTVAPTTTEVLTTTPDPGPLPRDRVRLVIANGDGRFQLATITADRIRALGYIIDVGDTLYRVDETVLFYRAGFDREATNAANDIGVPDAVMLEFSTDESQPITSSDASGDIIVVLGADAPR
jgi:hypothetical protein